MEHNASELTGPPADGEWDAVWACSYVDGAALWDETGGESVWEEDLDDEQWVDAGKALGPRGIDVMAPGAELAAMLAGLVPDELGPNDLIDALVGVERLGAWVDGLRTQMLARVAVARDVPVFSPDWAGVSEEVGVALAWAPRAASDRILSAHILATEHPQVLEAMALGQVRLDKAQTIADVLAPLDSGKRAPIELAMLRRVQTHTRPQLRAYGRRRVIKEDPEGFQARHDKAMDQREVNISDGDAGMAWVSAYLPATAAVAMYTVIDTLAAVKQPGDTRPIAHRRADILGEIFTRMLDQGSTPVGPLPVLQRRRARIHVTVPVTAFVGMQPGFGDLDGYGPIALSQVLDLASDGAGIETIIVDPDTSEALARLQSLYPRALPAGPSRVACTSQVPGEVDLAPPQPEQVAPHRGVHDG